ARADLAGITDRFHVATGQLPPVPPWPPGRELLCRYRVMEQAMAWLRRDNNALILSSAAT
ncbi:MAG: hypothetical protein ABSF69_28340, partial [Polyangiaceae bacterium]